MRTVPFDNPMQSQSAGISVINQEFNLIPQLTIAANIFLGREPRRRGGLVDWRPVNPQLRNPPHELGLDIGRTSASNI